MTSPIRSRPGFRSAALISLLALGAGACDDDGVILAPDDFEPELLEPVPVFVQEQWQGRDPLGQAAVELRWNLPDEWDGEAFRVYSRQSGGGNYILIATVTSCANRVCVYTDVNVVPGRSYDYFIAAVDERTNDEVGESEAWSVAVPSASAPTMPAGLVAIPLDNGVFLRWNSVGAEKYRVFLERVGADSVFFEIGGTDATGYLDRRAENGTRYTYRVAAVSGDGYVSRRSDGASAIPRPDYHADLIYSLTDNAPASGFRFVGSDTENPIVAGTSPQAHWRLERSGANLVIVPLAGTRVTAGTFTTDLSCGPGSEVDCDHVDTAPAASAFGTTPVVVSAGNTYVFQVTVSGQTHYAKVRAQGGGEDATGRDLMVFDWAYQLVPNEPALVVMPTR